jgi:hypothetical protein
VVGVTLSVAPIGQTKRCNDQALLGIELRDINVAEAQRKVDGERDKRKS